jgi:dihydroorotate dehydrogenase
MRFVKAARDRLEWGPPGAPPLLVKVAPDLDAAALKDVAAAATAAGVDGIVVGNTTVARPRERDFFAWFRGAVGWLVWRAKMFSNCLAKTPPLQTYAHTHKKTNTKTTSLPLPPPKKNQKKKTIQTTAEVQPYPAAAEDGGLSGPPLMGPSTAILADMYKATGGRLPLVGCGGVAGGADAYAKIRAGASLVELYTALAYEGA